MISCPDALANRSIIAFGFWYMVALCYKIKLDIKIVLKILKLRTKFRIAANLCDKIFSTIVVL